MTESKQYICKLCEKSFSKSSLLLRHSFVHDRTAAKFCCFLCCRSFTQKVTLKRHLKDLVCERKLLKQQQKPPSPPPRKAALSPTDRNNICIYCDKNFLKPSDLDRHIRTHTNERIFECTKANCKKAFKLKDTLNRHLATHEDKNFTCIVCSSTYMSKKTLQNHMRVHRHISFELLQTAQPLHVPASDVIVEEIYEEITDNNSIPLSDLLCDVNTSFLSLNSSATEINHVEIESFEMMKKIEEVQAVDESIVVEQKIPTKNKLVCETCGKSFAKPIDLRRHCDAVHEKKRPFKCFNEDCGKSFSLKCTRDRHQETHKNHRKLVTCKFCFKVLSSQSSLEFHMRIHENLKPHKCSECTLMFRTPGNLKSHLKVHFKEMSKRTTKT